MSANSLPAIQKLKSRKAIETLFRQGQRFPVFPVLIWHRWDKTEKGGVQAGFACSKKHFKKAVDRNRIKRQMREAYRLQKAALMETAAEKQQEVQLFFVYTGKTLPEYADLYKAIGKSLRQLNAKVHEVGQ